MSRRLRVAFAHHIFQDLAQHPLVIVEDVFTSVTSGPKSPGPLRVLGLGLIGLRT